VRTRSTSAAAAGALLLALVPAAVQAQSAGDGEVVFAESFTCEFGQLNPLELAPCVVAPDGSSLAITFVNPQRRSGPFDGIGVLDAALAADLVNGTFEVTGVGTFYGTLEGCGGGSMYFDYAAAGTLAEDGSLTWQTSVYASVGGSLPATASIDELAVNEAVDNGDGTQTAAYRASYTCDEAEVTSEAEGETDEATDQASD
jgi:hypothetical protein